MFGQICCSRVLPGNPKFPKYTLFCGLFIAITNVYLGRKHVIARLILALHIETCTKLSLCCFLLLLCLCLRHFLVSTPKEKQHSLKITAIIFSLFKSHENIRGWHMAGCRPGEHTGYRDATVIHITADLQSLYPFPLLLGRALQQHSPSLFHRSGCNSIPSHCAGGRNRTELSRCIRDLFTTELHVFADFLFSCLFLLQVNITPDNQNKEVSA